MTYRYADEFGNCFDGLEAKEQRAIIDAVETFKVDPRRRSLRSKKMQGHKGIFEISANMDLRITYHYEKPDTVVFRKCGHHDDTLKNP